MKPDKYDPAKQATKDDGLDFSATYPLVAAACLGAVGGVLGVAAGLNSAIGSLSEPNIGVGLLFGSLIGSLTGVGIVILVALLPKRVNKKLRGWKLCAMSGFGGLSNSVLIAYYFVWSTASA